MLHTARMLRASLLTLGPRDRVGILLGVVGLILCIGGLLIGIWNSLHDGALYDNAPATLFGRPFGAAIEMVLYVVGAVFLVASATLGRARLLQLQEAALIVSGVLYFQLHDELALFVVRLVMFTFLLYAAKYLLRLIRGPLDVIGFAGVECLNWGYLFNSPLGFAVGGGLLAAYNWVRFRRTGSWVNLLFLLLNIPFAGFAIVLFIVQEVKMIGTLGVFELIAASCLTSAAAIVTYLGVRYRRWPLEGASEEQRRRAADGQLTDYVGPPDAKMLFYEVASGHLVSFREVARPRWLLERVLALRHRALSGALSREEEREYEELSEVLVRVRQFTLDLLDRVGCEGVPPELLRAEPDESFITVDGAAFAASFGSS